ncbi:MAG: hypothetical protein HQ512_07725 [Rhodospirillales bacterium]|nr:hypothetical protein [Rhodospirillales bacterium]
MTIYFIIPKTNEAAFIATYLNQNIPDAARPGQIENAVMKPKGGVGTRMITGSSRVSQADADALALAHAPWLTIANTWPVDWDYGVS